MIMNSIKNVIGLVRGRPGLAVGGESDHGLTSGPGATLVLSFSMCSQSHCAYGINQCVFIVSHDAESRGTREMRQRSGATFHGGRQHRNIEREWLHPLFHSRLSFDRQGGPMLCF